MKLGFNPRKIRCINLLILFLIGNIFFVNSYCGHDKFERPLVQYINSEYSQKNNWKPLRILADFSELKKVESPEAKNFAALLESIIIPKTVQVLSSILKVRRLDSFTIDNLKCSKFLNIPEIYLKKKITADLLIIVNFDMTGKYKAHRVEASAVHCAQDTLTKRSLIGKITFRDDLNPTSPVDIDYMIWLCLHEISHILLFNRALYINFIDENFNSIPLEKILYETANNRGQKVFAVQTKNVLEKAKKHFNCPGLTGVPLEFNSRESTLITGHWSRRAMNTDYMIGRSHGENMISEITLAFFEDSGWYKPEYSKANMFFWGKDKGCNFFYGNCVKISRTSTDLSKISVRTHYKKEFCQNINQPLCSRHNHFRGFCGAKVFDQDLPIQYKNFDSLRVGGYDKFVNRCPITVENKFNQRYYGGNCQYGSTTQLFDFEKVCPECSCFMSSLRKNPKEDVEEINRIHSYPIEPSLKSVCYEFKCVNDQIHVVIEEKSYICPMNKRIRIAGFYGRIYCPDSRILCNSKYFCKFGCTDV